MCDILIIVRNNIMKDRIFISINPPKEVKAELSNFINNLKKQEPEINWIKPDYFHLTLIFLGNLEKIRTAKVTAILKFIAKNQKGFTLRFGGFEFFPAVNPKIVWARGDGSLDLFNLQKSLEAQLRFNNFNLGDRQFIPHFSIGKINKKIKNIEVLADKLNSVNLSDFYVDHLDVMKSKGNGANLTYERLFRIPLSTENVRSRISL